MKALQHPRLLSDFCWVRTREFRAKLNRDLVLDLRKGLRGNHEFHDASGILFAVLNDDRFTVIAGQGSNLCSPAVRIWGDKWIGTPSGEGEALAGFGHDFLVRVERIPCSGITRKISNDIFYDLLIEKRSWFSGIYHGVVAGPLGEIYMRGKGTTDTCKCHEPR